MFKSGIVMLVFFLVVASAQAAYVDGSLDSNVLLREYGGEFVLTINAIDVPSGVYNVYTLSDVQILPIENFEIDSTPFERSFEVVPMQRLMDFDGQYVLSYYLNNRKEGVKYNDQIALQILSISDVLTVDTNPIELGDTVATLNIRNTHNVSISNVSASFSSLLFDVEEVFSIGPYENISFIVPIDSEKLKTIKAGSYIIDVDFDTPNGVISTIGALELSEEEGVTTQDETNGFFVRTTLVNKINTGNVDRDVRVQVERNIFNRFFTTFNVAPISEVREGMTVTYSWSKKIGPSEVFTVRARTNNFYPLLIVVLLVLAFVGLRRMFATKLSLEKSVTPIKTKNGEFALRVYVTAKAMRHLDDVTLIDRIPKTVKIYRKFGNSVPDEIDATNRRLKWHVGEMQSGEERTFTYIVYSRVGYVGRFVLPSAVSRFLLSEKVYQIESNSVYFLAEQSSGLD